MSKETPSPPTQAEREMAEAAAKATGGLFSEFYYFLKHHKKWWLLPIVLALLALGAVALLSGSAAAPFIYPFF